MTYFPFIHKIKKKKHREESLPLYIEQIPPPPIKKAEEEKDSERGVVIIELL
jgi:hypothetical protein